MAESQVYSALDIVRAAAESNPLGVKNAFDSSMIDKIRDAISGKRETVASTAFGGTPEVDLETEVEAGDND